MSLNLPTPERLSSLFGGLLDKELSIKPVDAVDRSSGDAMTTAEYIGDDGVVKLICCCDIALGSSVSAALMMIPAGVAEESAKSGVMADNLMENMREIYNIFATLLNGKHSDHVHLGEVHSKADEIPDELSGKLASPSARVDYIVTVPGYSGGNISFLAV